MAENIDQADARFNLKSHKQIIMSGSSVTIAILLAFHSYLIDKDRNLVMGILAARKVKQIIFTFLTM